MQVHKIQQINNDNQTRPQFKGFADGVLRYLATNQAIGANGVDLAFMVIPRTTTDFIGRGPAAGVETARREASGTVNHSLIGVYGGLSGALLATLYGIDRKFGTKSNSMFVAPETLNILAENKAKQIQNEKSQFDYLKETFSRLKAYNPTAKKVDAEGFVELSETTVNEIASIIDKALKKEGASFKEWKNEAAADSLHVVKNKLIEATGAESKYVLESADKKIVSNTGLKTLLEDIYKVSESFNRKEVQEAFKEQIKNGKPIAENTFVKKLTKFMKGRSVAGFLIGTGIGMSIQTINIYLTKKKTGSDGFVGVEGRTKDDSTAFKMMKGAAGVGFLGLTMATLGTGFKGFMDKMAFKGFWPTISQLKGIYGLTIISRLLATRDKDELRESLTKDTLGFLSWLVLGDFVNKMAAEGFDKSVMNRTKDVEGKNFFKRVFNSSLKTRDEILIESLATKDIKATKLKDGKLIAKTFKEMLADLNNIADKEFVKNTKRRLSTLNKAQLAGYAFSGLVLGLGIPNLNIYITNKLDKKRKAKAEMEEQMQLQTAKA